ncbi:MAG: SGNH/GDSL hydrolase family protein [Dehalococcoidia bacterium]
MVRRSLLLPCALLVLAIAAFACDDGSSNVTTSGLLPEGEEGGVYLALGDSIAAGEGASDPDTTDYVAQVAEALRARYGESLAVQSLAVGGHTTEDLIDTQLAPAVEAVQQGDVRVVTVTIGGNDLFQYSADPDCIVDPADPACPLEAGLADVEQRLDQILGDLRVAGPDTVIAIEVYPNLFSSTGHEFSRPADTAFRLLNGVIEGVARRHEVLVADPVLAFEGRGPEYTHILDPTADFHPNDAGYDVIAEAFLEALGLEAQSDE